MKPGSKNKMEKKEQLIKDIQNLLNSYDGVRPTSINPDLLNFMDEETLISIIDSLLTQKEKNSESDVEWLEQFKTNS
ncbi:hypothetical protein Saut_1124 [Sulfurimonas autotrophica DSM 16294]|uniref:Uncharacterized protein n=2 Tax=Sulfurimonas autotrophica TaxID=202747 RepID=E0USK9_SULAO|nr:hypothetical protein Saut_1124 [Sulfurimonas autotrophica DSM 16294]